MSRSRIVLAAALAVAALAVLAAPASASVHAANTAKFCKAVDKIGDAASGQPTKATASRLITPFKAASDSAPSSVKKSIAKITKYLNVLASGDVKKLADLTKSGAYEGYAKAISSYSTYVAANC